jgi:hypothetical protein
MLKVDREIFYTLMGAKVLTEPWREHYNHCGSHSSLGYRPPAPEAVDVGMLGMGILTSGMAPALTQGVVRELGAGLSACSRTSSACRSGAHSNAAFVSTMRHDTSRVGLVSSATLRTLRGLTTGSAAWTGCACSGAVRTNVSKAKLRVEIEGGPNTALLQTTTT